MPTKVIVDDKKLKKLLHNTVLKTTRQWTIQDGVEYGMFIELGTSKMAARPALVPAFEKVVNKKFIEYIRNAIEQQQPLDPALAKAAFDIQHLWASNVPVETGAYRNSIKVFGSQYKVSTTAFEEG